MVFLHPLWLLGLLALAIPILIHLFNFRRHRKLYFTNLAYLRNLKNETRRQQRLRHLLVLISRMLIITFIVLAFARPYIPGPLGGKQAALNHVSIYIDNSLSMQAASGGLSLLDMAIAKALELLDAYSPSDRFQLITNDFEGKHQPYYNRDDFEKLLKEVIISPRIRTLAEAHERMLEMKPGDTDAESHFYLVSDFQRSSSDLSFIGKDTSTLVFFLPVIASSLENVYIDSCWFGSPYNHAGQLQDLFVSLVNASEAELERIPLRFMVDGVQRGLTTFDIGAGGRATVKLPFTNRDGGPMQGQLSIDDHPLIWDDRMYLSWTVKERIPVFAISEGGSGFYLRSLFSNDSVFAFSEEDLSRLDYRRFLSSDLVVLDNIPSISTGMGSELEKFVSNGGSLLLIPGNQANLPSLNSFLDRFQAGRFEEFDTARLIVTGLNVEHELFRDVFETIPENPDLPFVLGHYPMQDYRIKGADMLMDLQNGDPLVSHLAFGKGRLYITTTPAGDKYGNLVRHAIWVPLMYRMAMLSRPQQQLYYTIGKDDVISIPSMPLDGDRSPVISHAATNFEFIPGIRRSGESVDLFTYGRIAAAGHYALKVPENSWQSVLSFNYDRRESDPGIIHPDELSEWVNREGHEQVFIVDHSAKTVGQAIMQLTSGNELWPWFIWLALFFLLLEVLLLRLFRK